MSVAIEVVETGGQENALQMVERSNTGLRGADVEGAPQVAVLDTERMNKAQSRGMTLAGVRKTIVQGAQEIGGAVSDATSYAITTSVESIIVAVLDVAKENWGDEALLDQSLTLCEMFVLMWRSSKGNIEGRTTSTALQAIAFGTVLVEFVRRDYITLEKMRKTMGGMSWKRWVLHPVDMQPPDNFMYENFVEIKDSHDAGERATVAKWVENIATSELGTQTVQNIIDELCDKQILAEKKSTFGTKYDITKQEPREKLVKAMRKVLLDDEQPALCIRVLLRFMRLADKEYLVRSPFLSNVLNNKAEWTKAKEKLKEFDSLPNER